MGMPAEEVWYISPISPLYLAYFSPISPLYLPYIEHGNARGGGVALYLPYISPHILCVPTHAHAPMRACVSQVILTLPLTLNPKP